MLPRLALPSRQRPLCVVHFNNLLYRQIYNVTNFSNHCQQQRRKPRRRVKDPLIANRFFIYTPPHSPMEHKKNEPGNRDDPQKPLLKCLSSHIHHRHHQQLQQQQNDHHQQQRRYYHATPRTEIIPLVAVGALVTITYYSYRAWKRMGEEWDDYQYEKHEYERWIMASKNNNNNNESIPKTITLAIDLGTAFTKIASKSTDTSTLPEVMITREGDRSFFNGIIYNGENHITGRAALERYFFPNENEDHHHSQNVVKMPFLSLMSEDSKQLIADVLREPVQEVWDRLQTSETVLRRRIVTIPTFFLQQPRIFQTAFEQVVTNTDHNNTSSHTTVFVPEPVAALWGAQMQNDDKHSSNGTSRQSYLLPQMNKTDPVLVIDVGGWTTQVSVVQNHRVLGCTTLTWGGEVVVEHCVKLLRQKQESNHPPMTDARAQALLQWHARTAVHELSYQTRVNVHIPYVFADPKQHHLDAQLARPVLEQMIEDHISDLVNASSSSSSLSPSLPTPTDLKSWFTSAVTRILEDSNVLPTNLKACLVVGGASRIPLVQRSLQSTLDMLLGPLDIAVVPPFQALTTTTATTVQHPAEWTVLGAATLAPSFGYSIPDGLVMSVKS